MKKILTFIITLLLIVNSSGLVLAKATNTLGSSTNVLYSKYIPTMNSSSNLSSMFTISENEIEKLVLQSKIEYDITINYAEAAASHVTMNGNLSLNNHIYSFETKGEVNKITIKNKTLLNGPLEGHMLIGDKKVNLTLHLQKFEDATKPFVTMSIYDSENDINSFLAFGDKIITKDFADKIKSTLPKKNLNNTKSSMLDSTTTALSSFATTSASGFEWVGGNSATGVSTNLSKNAPYQASAFEIDVYSNETAIENLYSDVYAAFAISAQANLTSSNYSFSISDTAPGANEEARGTTSLMSLLEDVLGLFGIPTSTLSTILGSSSGFVDVYGNAYNKTVLVQSINRLDIGNQALPFFFTVNPPSIGNCVGTFKATVKYMCYDIYDSTFYHTSQTTSRSFSALVS